MPERTRDVTIHVISHTHWDREWYRTNQEFRVELVSVVDEVLAALQRQEGFFSFTLDGQAILLEDYLQMRPEQAETVRALVRGGNLLVGPWYTQPDEFLVSGESIVRNLQAGTQTAANYGGAMRVGWVPDAFGHVSQLPQILSQFDIRCAALTRGVGNELDGKRTDFIWQSPDGSQIYVAHQVQGYFSGGLLGFPYFWGNIHRHPPSVGIARKRLLRLIEPEGDPPDQLHVALWNGADHLYPEPELAQTLDLLEESIPGYRIIHSSVPEYVRAVERAGWDRPVIRGELRGSRHHALLPSILSSRIPLKQRNQRVERLLARHSEPIAAFAAILSPFAAAQGQLQRFIYPSHALRESWKLLLQNHGHDSIGGCSIDQVHREMGPRFDQAEQIARAVCQMGIERAAISLDTRWVDDALPAFVCFSPFDRSGIRTVVHEFVWSENLEGRVGVADHTGRRLPCQLLECREDRYQWLQQQTTAGDVAENAWWWSEVLHRMDRLGIHSFEVDSAQGTRSLTLHLADESSCREEIITALVAAFRGLQPEAAVEIKARFFRHRIAFTARLPALSLTALRVELAPDTRNPRLHVRRELDSVAVSAADRVLRFNGHRLVVELDGTLTLFTAFGQEHHGLVRLVDEGDRGDSYDFSPVLERPTELEPAGEITITLAESGPVRVALDVSYTVRLPASLAEDRERRSSTQVEMALHYRVSVHAGCDRVEVDGTIENLARDHRLRAYFSAGISASHVVADGQFCVEERPVQAPQSEGWAQRITAIRPHQNWVSIADETTGLCVHTDGLQEHEAVKEPDREETTLAITLLRSFGWLSRGDLSTRRGQAGPMIETPDAQLPGRNRFRFAFRVVPGSAALRWSECTSQPAFLEHVTTPARPGTEGLDAQVSLIDLSETDLALSAVKASIRVPGATVVRFFNTSMNEVTAHIGVSRIFDRATRVLLDETPVGDEELEAGVLSLQVRPAEIITIRLEAAPHHRVLRAWKTDGSRA